MKKTSVELSLKIKGDDSDNSDDDEKKLTDSLSRMRI